MSLQIKQTQPSHQTKIVLQMRDAALWLNNHSSSGAHRRAFSMAERNFLCHLFRLPAA
jgi:hypothetical protein